MSDLPGDTQRGLVSQPNFSTSRPGPAECYQGDPELASYKAKKRHFLHTTGLGAVFWRTTADQRWEG